MINSTPALFTALSSIPVLTGVSPAALTLIAHEGVVRDFTEGVWIVREGEEGHSFFIIAEGDVEIIKRADTPDATLLANLHRGAFFGEMCIIEPMVRSASVRALGPVRLIEIKAATLHHLFKKMPDDYAIVLFNLARDMARRLRSLDEAFAARAY